MTVVSGSVKVGSTVLPVTASLTLPTTEPTLQQGASGPAVVTLQQSLNIHGASLVADGSFGPLTLAAVKNFQSLMQVTVDGIVGPVTWGLLLIPMPTGVPGGLVGRLVLDANGAAMLAWQHTATGNQGQNKPGTYSVDSSGNLSLSISGAAGTFCQVWGPTFGPVGIYESRVFLPNNGSGAIANWPAWWLYGGNGADELDIIEGLGGRSAVHLWWKGGNAGGGWSTIGPGWHTGTAVITATNVQVYIDGSMLSNFGKNPLVTQMHVIHDIMAGMPPGTTQSGPPATYLAQYTRVWTVA